jgi:hypothetical protein
MQQMTLMECVKHAWASACDTAKAMPMLMLGVYVAYTALGWIAFAGRPVPGGDTPSAALVIAADVASLVNSIVYLGFIVKVHRFVLLREGATPLVPLGGKPLARIFGVGILLTLALVVTAVLLYAVLRPHYSGGVAFLGFVVGVVWIFVAVRISLIFPSLAIGNRIDLRAAWHDSRGRFWSLFGTTFVAMLPIIVCGVVVLIFFGLAGITPATLTSPARLLLLAAGQGVANVVFALITGTTQSWLYRRYADRLPAPPAA